MYSFRELFNEKMNNTEFKALYEKECHICGMTMAFIGELTARGLSLEEIAENAGVDLERLKAIESGDLCCLETIKKVKTAFQLKTDCRCPNGKN